MPAPFVRDLCRYRNNGKPNTSDASEKLSIEIGEALFDIIGVPRATPDDEPVTDEPTGGVFARCLIEDLERRTQDAGSVLSIIPERRLNTFEQYRHVGLIRGFEPGPSKAFDQAWRRLTTRARRSATEREAERIEPLIVAVEAAITTEANARRALLDELGDESLLGLDVTVSRPGRASTLPLLEAGFSLKWSLRTDRAQDCRSQGAKMSTLRRGRMPHFAAVTMEPRPYMLNLLGGGSGDVDCVYHLDLSSLSEAVEKVYIGSKLRLKGRDVFRRLVDQRRIRDYDDLVLAVAAM